MKPELNAMMSTKPKQQYTFTDPLGIVRPCSRKRVADALRYCRKYGGSIGFSDSAYHIYPNDGLEVKYKIDYSIRRVALANVLWAAKCYRQSLPTQKTDYLTEAIRFLESSGA